MQAGFGGGFIKARAELGVSSFGLQVIAMPANFEDYPEHDHEHDGQEEVYLALSGSGSADIDGERVVTWTRRRRCVPAGHQAQGARGPRGAAGCWAPAAARAKAYEAPADERARARGSA